VKAYYWQYPERIKDLIGQHIGEDYLPHIDHPSSGSRSPSGGGKAVYDQLGTNFGIMPNSTIMVLRKKKFEGASLAYDVCFKDSDQ